MEFAAEAKRSFYSPRESLRAGRGSIWLPAKVELVGRTLRVSTKEWTEEFEVRRFTRREPRIIHLSGHDQNTPRRRTLRFARLEDADLALAVIHAYPDVTEESLEEPLGDAVPVQVQHLIPKTVAVYFAPIILLPASLLLTAYFGLGYFVALLGLVFIAYFMAFPAFLGRAFASSDLELSRCWRGRLQSAWLKVRDGYLSLGYPYGAAYSWVPHEPRRLEWLDSRSLVLRTQSDTLVISFFNADDAASSLRKVKDELPSVVETFSRE